MTQPAYLLISGLFFMALTGGIIWGDAKKTQPAVQCPQTFPSRPILAVAETYRNTPFKAGEKAVYEIHYAGILAGHAYMNVNPPVQYKDIWHRQFQVEVKSLESYETLYHVHDVMKAISDPYDFRVAKFYLKQDEESLFSNRFRQSKSITFEHERCKVRETIQRHEKRDKIKEFDLVYGAKDSLGMIYYLRTLQYDLNTPVRTLVYSSEKNWWLEAVPVVKENVTVSAGEFETIKLQLVTYLGKELQQQGEVYIWIAQTPQRPLVKVQAEVALGSLWFELLKYEPGTQDQVVEAEEIQEEG